ncbi:MAG: DUF1801 domain-containing protein [Calditrichaeota bacterium]|nr:DUF1801 domain-containing protein [Calditrichota bacterium]
MESNEIKPEKAFGLKNPEVDKYISELTPPLDQISEELRGIIHQVVPEIVEHFMFNQPWFFYYGPLCYIRVRKGHVYFGFKMGVALTDPQDLMEGKGKLMRHLKMKSLTDIPREQLITWIKEAVEYNKPDGSDFDTFMKTSVDGDEC